MRRFALLLAVGVLGGCEPRSASEASEAPSSAAIEAAVSARVDGYVQAIRDRDLEYMQGFWADVEGFTVAGDGALTVGYDAWMEQLRSAIEGTEAVDYVETSNPRVYVLGPDAASYSMAYRWSMSLRDGSTLKAEGSWMYVFKRFGDDWRVVHSAGSHVYS